ncbi:MAG: hypothetical protein HKM01_06555 [Gallionella sp.]|nr:hypothetical protein [Gallionella sp.]
MFTNLIARLNAERSILLTSRYPSFRLALGLKDKSAFPWNVGGVYAAAITIPANSPAKSGLAGDTPRLTIDPALFIQESVRIELVEM